jgi:regulator of protease activity HflC (stomatin/prohibitin superfamily)
MGGLSLDETLTSRETVNTKLRVVLDEATEKWGVKVTRVELREIEPPAAIKEAMAKQMTAERERRAEVTKAEGDKASAILQAEGDKASRILRAQGERDATVAQAEGRKKAAILEAEGKSEATRLVFEAIHSGRATPEVLALRYLEALQDIGRGSNKVFVPYEATAALASIGALKELFGGGGAGQSGAEGANLRAPPDPSATRPLARSTPAQPSTTRPAQGVPPSPRSDE